MNITKIKKISLATIIVALLSYAPFVFSKVMHLAGLQDYWIVFWVISYLLYIIAGLYFVHLFEKKEEIILAGIVSGILSIHWFIWGSLLATKYFLSHSFYGFLVLAITMFVYRPKQG